MAATFRLAQPHYEIFESKPPHQYTIFATCNSCRNGLVNNISLNEYWLVDVNNPPFSQDGVLDTPWLPIPSKTNTPTDLPANVAPLYAEAAHNLEANNPYSASMMFRKTLEVALQNFNPNPKDNLSKNIDNLFNKGLIPKSLSDWAHTCKEIGNDAAHREVTQNDAQSIADLTYFLLTYLISVPAQIQAKLPTV